VLGLGVFGTPSNQGFIWPPGHLTSNVLVSKFEVVCFAMIKRNLRGNYRKKRIGTNKLTKLKLVILANN